MELLSRPVCQLTISFHTFLGMTLHVVGQRRNTKIRRVWMFFSSPRRNSRFKHGSAIVHNIFAYFTLSLGTACDIRAPHRLTHPAFEVHPGTITFPPEADSLWSHISTGPSASRNAFSVSTITDGNARIGDRSTFPALTLA